MFNRINIIDADFKNRAEMNKMFNTVSDHVELFDGIDDFFSYLPSTGTVFLSNDAEGSDHFFQGLEDRGRWLPTIVYDQMASPDKVVDALVKGAIDFFEWPFGLEVLNSRLEHIKSRSDLIGSEMSARARAKSKVADLTPRESQVLEALAIGNSNKSIARLLELSPRTVEIHRANMMEKLSANHASEAVWIAADAGFTKPAMLQDDQASQVVSTSGGSPS